MQILFDFLKATVGMAVVMTAWFGMQALVRRAGGRPAQEDVLGHLAHGCCGECSNAGQCDKQDKERNHHHEPA